MTENCEKDVVVGRQVTMEMHVKTFDLTCVMFTSPTLSSLTQTGTPLELANGPIEVSQGQMA